MFGLTSISCVHPYLLKVHITYGCSYIIIYLLHFSHEAFPSLQLLLCGWR